MEGFLEANRIAEVSLTKLNRIHKCGELPLRKTLLISKVLNTAQDVATSAQQTFLNNSAPNTASRSSSKLLASISKRVEDSDVCESDCAGLSRPSKHLSRQSPLTTKVEDEESMDFENVSSVLSDILESDSSAAAVPQQIEEDKSVGITVGNKNSLSRSSFLSDVTNTPASAVWGAWQFEVDTDTKNARKEQWLWPSGGDTTATSLTSPGKRHHTDAFPSSENHSTLALSSLWEDEEEDIEEAKRFKPSPPEGCPLESLPGFCGYLSPKNLQSAPLITYMFGSGFSSPSSTAAGWSTNFNSSENHFESPLPPTSPMSFNPILAF